MVRSEEGFTLVETLVTVVITGIIGGAVTASIIIGLRTTDATANRLADSRDAQLAAAYFGTDVQGTDQVVVGSSTPPACAPPGDPATRIVDLIDHVDDGSSLTVSYFTHDTAPGSHLRRVACTSSGATVGDTVVAADLASTPTATCPLDPGPTCPSEPKQVKLTVSVSGCSATGPTCRPGVDGSPYHYDLIGTTRSI